MVIAGACNVTAPAQGAYVRAILAPEVSAGVLTETEVDVLLDRDQRKAYLEGTLAEGRGEPTSFRR